MFWQPDMNGTNWDPVSPFNRSDSDLSMFWLSQNSIEYDQPTFDPLYFANGTFKGTWGFQGNHWVNVMACADKHQFCNPVTNSCAPWGGFNSIMPQLLSLSYNPAQLSTASRLHLPAVSADTWSSVGKLGPAGERS
jgi:hypothetical protein